MSATIIFSLTLNIALPNQERRRPSVMSGMKNAISDLRNFDWNDL